VLPGQGQYYNPDFLTPEGPIQEIGYVTDLITDDVLAWLEEGRDPSKPFVLMYQHKAPHRSWQPGPEHLRSYEDVQIPEPDTLFDDYSGRTTAAREQEMTVAHHLRFAYDLKLWPPSFRPDEDLIGAVESFRERLTAEQLAAWDAAYGPRNEAFYESPPVGDDLVRWKYQRYMHDYLRAIRSVDDNLGRLLAYLDEAGLADNTVVIYSSDQGFYLGEHGWFDKRWMYEESLRMPLIVRWPGVVEPGSENYDLVQNLDLAETFLDMGGAPVPAHMQGRSMVPLLRGETPADWRDAIYYQYYEFPGVHAVQRHYGVRTQRYKLIHYYLIDEWELFDLEADPDELHSVYEDPSYGDVRTRLANRLAELRAHYRVPDVDPVPIEGW
jgi:arylsulfatase A-like enzyme